MLALTNSDRTYHDRWAPSFAERLATYAKSHSEEMALRRHLPFPTRAQAARGAGRPSKGAGGENAGVEGPREPPEGCLRASELHRKNILAELYEHAAAGIARADDRIWVTVIFYG